MMRMVLELHIPVEKLSSLVSVWSGSAPVKADIADAFTALYALPVLGNYGATEFCGAVATWSLDDDGRYRSSRAMAVGRVQPSVASVRVRNPLTDAILPLGERGVLELQVKRVGPHWLPTTDLAHIDAKGFLYLHGRTHDAIERGGLNISPDTIAGVLRQNPAVRDAAVVGIADARLGEVPVAVVKSGAPADKCRAHRFCSYEPARLFLPVAICVVDVLLRIPTMKIDRRAMR